MGALRDQPAPHPSLSDLGATGAQTSRLVLDLAPASAEIHTESADVRKEHTVLRATKPAANLSQTLRVLLGEGSKRGL